MNPSLATFKRKLFTVSLSFVITILIAHTQPLTKEDHNKKLSLLSEKEKVDYIINNHYALYSSDFDNAIKLTEEGILVSRKNKWKDKEAYCEMFGGVSLFLKGKYDKALPKFLRAYDIFDSLQHYKGLARLCNEMGVFYRRQQNNATAKEYLDKAESFALKTNDQESLGTTYGHRAVILEREGNIKEAEELYEKVYKIRLEQKDSVGLSYALLDIANIYLRRGDLKKTFAFIGQSTSIREKLGDHQGVAVNLVNTGETYFSVKDYRNAIKYFEKCLEKAIAVGYTDLIRYTYEQLSAAHVALGDYKSAYAYQAKGHAFNDSLYNIEKAKVIAEMQEKYESEKKEQQITLQNSALAEQRARLEQTYIIIISLLLIVGLLIAVYFLSRERFRRKQQLLQKEHDLTLREAFIQASIQSQEDERKRFAQDLHDGMGQLISALRLNLHSVNRNTSLAERVNVVGKAEVLLNDMHREIRSIAFNLMPQTLVQHGLVPALNEMSDRVHSNSKIVVRINAFDVPERLQEVQEISLYRIIQEWVNNVLKYSNANLLEIQLVGYENELSVTIEDNGDGFDNKVLTHSTGNGWKNIQSRINLIKGTVEIDSTPGRKGTTLILRMPLTIVQKASVPVRIL